MQITTSKGETFEALMVTDATWDRSVLVQLRVEQDTRLSAIASSFEDIDGITTDAGDAFAVGPLNSVFRIASTYIELRLQRRETT